MLEGNPTLLLKRSSVQRGEEATIALMMSHGEEVNWAKVSSSLAYGPAKMKGFFAKAKKYSQNLISLILPVLTPSNATPSLSAPPLMDPTSPEVS
jgi:hypothetical protein